MTSDADHKRESSGERRARKRIGTTLKQKYRLDELLGVGGMAAVYSATHRNSKRVAIKLLHPELSIDEDTRARFLREGYVANQVGHEDVVVVDDDDVAEDGSAFIVMELLDGETLDTRARRMGGWLPLAEVLRHADQLLDVLAAAHDKGIVHRDIKPGNLFFTRDGRLKVLDFGIARLAESEQVGTSTRTGRHLGTPAFMAPEQARGRWDEVDLRTDLWAVGATMFTLVSGRTVHLAETTNEILALAIHAQAPSLADVVAGLPESVIAVVDRALRYDKQDRFASARDMRLALAEIIRTEVPEGAAPIRLSTPAQPLSELPSGAPTLAAQSRTEPAEPPRAAGRSRAPLLAALLGLVGLGVVAFAFFGFGDQEGQRPDPSLSEASASLPPLGAPPDGSAISAQQNAKAATPPEQLARREPEPDAAAVPPSPEASAGELATAAPKAAPRRPAPRTAPEPKADTSDKADKPAVKRPGCDPNYFIDERGIKTFKPECF